jgi:starch-binding outer membrane protein, SusD/RagB family
MKNYIFKSLFVLLLLFLFSCEDYLDKAPESTLTVNEVFKDFDHTQGFIEEMYALVVDIGTGGGWQTDYLYGDDAYVNNVWMPSAQIDKGNLDAWRFIADFSYLATGLNANANPYNDLAYQRPGIWDGSLYGIRKANIAIQNVELMTNATQEERNVILGQAYFFRAFFHFEIMKYWGRFPYIKEVLASEYKLPRPATYKECALEANEDFKKAAELLPVNWDNESYGQKTLGENKGRLTKGAAYAFQGKNLLFAASPLMKGTTDTYDYDTELCSMAVDAFAEVLKLVDQGVYKLVPFAQYEEVFWKVPSRGQWPGSTEFIFNGMGGNIAATKRFAEISMDQKVKGGGAVLISPTHNFINNNFGMANGLSIEDDLSGAYGTPTYDPTKPFKNRDPRFYKWITVDGDTLATVATAGNHRTAKLFVGGLHRTWTGTKTGYFFKKFYPTLYSKWNAGIINNNTPWRIRMRLTDVYLMYAEALHAAKNNASTVPATYSLTAEQAINIMRDRAGVPHVHPSIVGNPNKFMDELRRERSVELSFEAHRWEDIRRWSVAHLDKYRKKTALNFPANHSYFQEVVLIERVCDYPKHFWLPFGADQTQFYEGFPQNPGW